MPQLCTPVATLRNIHHALSTAGLYDESERCETRRSLLAMLVPLAKEIRVVPEKEKPMRRAAWREAAVKRGVRQDDSGSWTVDMLRVQIKDSLAQLKLEAADSPFIRAFTMKPVHGHAVHQLGKNVENKSKELKSPGWVLHNVSSAPPQKNEVTDTRAAALTAFAATQVDSEFATAHTASFGTSTFARNAYLGAVYLDIPSDDAEAAAADKSPWRRHSEPHAWVIRRAICFFKNEHGATCNPGLPYSIQRNNGAEKILQAIQRRLSPENPEFFFSL
jgi:hypothetical protein